MKLIIGLGNPGEKYQGTRHNIGAEVVEELCRLAGVSLKAKWRLHAFVGKVPIDGAVITVARSRTYMNLSGGAAAALLKWERCAPEDLLVVSDDINLPLGRLRIRPHGSSGGHKGLESIIQAIGSDRFPRMRIGVGGAAESWVDHVLGKFPRREQGLVKETVYRAIEAMRSIVTDGLDVAMNRFNAVFDPVDGY